MNFCVLLFSKVENSISSNSIEAGIETYEMSLAEKVGKLWELKPWEREEGEVGSQGGISCLNNKMFIDIEVKR